MPEPGQAMAVTGPRNSGKSMFLKDLSRANPDAMWLMPAMNLSTDEAKEAGAQPSQNVFTWLRDVESCLVLIDETDCTISERDASAFHAILRYLLGRGCRLVIATHINDIVERCDQRTEVAPGGLHDRWWSAFIMRQMAIARGYDPKTMSSLELLHEWNGWPFIDTEWGAGMIFNVSPVGCEKHVEWILVNNAIHNEVTK